MDEVSKHGMLTDRKDEHLSIILENRHGNSGKSTGFELIDFEHCALPDLDIADIDVGQTFLGKSIGAPVLVSSMTGGPTRASAINQCVAIVCEELKLPFAVGSQRIAIEQEGSAGLGKELRRIAPSVPILGNIGVAQLNLGFGIDEARRAVEMIDANALYVHLNPLQEAVQPEGDRDWSGLFEKIVAINDALHVPIVVKEVGFGISASLARRFTEAGIGIIDIAGAGGTNWAMVEAARMDDSVRTRFGNTFASWGIPTANAVIATRSACPDATVVASGGIKSGLDVAKAIRIGADVAGQAAALLPSANESPEALLADLAALIEELRITCFCTGSMDLETLRSAPLQKAILVTEPRVSPR
jgi:isopentenyl-diphosphate Delta-isomerase